MRKTHTDNLTLGEVYYFDDVQKTSGTFIGLGEKNQLLFSTTKNNIVKFTNVVKYWTVKKD